MASSRNDSLSEDAKSRLHEKIVPRDVGRISKCMYEWEGGVSDALGLTQVDVAAIKEKHKGNLTLQTRAALQLWLERNGPAATYQNLICLFIEARKANYADTVWDIIKEPSADPADTLQTIRTVKPQSLVLTQEKSYSEIELSVLKENEDRIRQNFAHLVCHILDMLMKHTINIKGFRVFLGNVVYGLCLEEIPTSASISDIFEFITDKKLWSLDNYTPLHNIAREYLSDSLETKQLIDNYKKQLSFFKATTSLVDYIARCEDREADPDEPLEPNYDKTFYRKLAVKLKVRVTNETLEYVDEIWRELATFFLLPTLSVLLDSVVSGSLVITWLIPHDFASMIREGIEGEEVEEFFRKNSIVGVNIDEEVVYEFDAKLHLLEACECGDVEEVEDLLQDFDDYDFSQHEDTPLVAASRHGHYDVVQILLLSGFEVDDRDKGGWTALMWASQEGRTDVVELLIKHHADVNATSKDGVIALMVASQEGRTDVVELLINHHCDVNATTKNGRTSLMVASHHGRTDVVELLIKHHADVNATSESGSTALMEASIEGHVEIADSLLLQGGADPNIADESGRTALMYASVNNHLQVVQLLLKYNAHVNALDKEGETALMASCEKGNRRVVGVLLEHNANVNQKKEDGRTALMVASQEGRTDVVDLLIKHCCDVNARNEDGWTALMLASQNGRTDVVELLIKHHADVNAKEEDGLTPLMIACQNGKTDVVELLINHNADLNAKTKNGMTALMMAHQKGQTDLVELLKRHNADVSVMTEARMNLESSNRTTQEEVFILPEAIKFGYHKQCSHKVTISEDGLAAERQNSTIDYDNGVVYGSKALRGTVEFEVQISSHLGIWKPAYDSKSVSLKLGVMRCKSGTTLDSGNYPIPRCSLDGRNHCVWSSNKIHNRLKGYLQTPYGDVNLDELREGDRVGMRLTSSGVLVFFVNGRSQGVAAENIYQDGYDVYPVVDHFGNYKSTEITRAAMKAVNLQDMCLTLLSTWLKSKEDVNTLPLPERIQESLKQLIHE